MDGSKQESQWNEKEFASLHELADFVSAHVQCPVTIESRDLELMAYSGNHNEPDAVRMNTILSKRAAAHVVHYLHESGWLQRIEEASGVVKIPTLTEIGLGPRTVACIKSGKKIYGYLWVQEASDAFAEEHQSFLVEAAKKAAEWFEQQMSVTRKRQKEMERILMSFIREGAPSDQAVKIEAELRGIKLPKEFVVVLFRVLRSDRKEIIRHYIIFSMNALSGSTFLIENHEQLICIIGNPSVSSHTALDQARLLLEKLEKEFHCDLQRDVLVGIGKEYRRLKDLRQSYTEATEVIHIKTRLHEPLGHFYEELGIYRLLPAIYAQHKRQRYQNEQLQKLKRYDMENQTTLVETLKQYLKNDGKIKETAEDLYIHPNTLHYRIKRIQAITDIDFADFEQRMMLYIDLLLLQYKDDIVFDTQI
ncbi:helix-turn-helix domain-containing protein [Anoxybacillus rupiensis]|uniref:Helix-turn-helix domain-containing protein n=1 Tax=Anoxybacteroides rupiense TaxID=311460 RepID=A0ABT5W822_9BACL|nr:helix-turn-helix domain-containing protein [Anoxybacillus rupiensis]MBS2772173.1 helix-turn-helix domain-containing protein [Anoxybacillus rupiensis]MDE8565468.1 helix-turn-helix domain-containing protein [Anoxybacillus rupiensis]